MSDLEAAALKKYVPFKSSEVPEPCLMFNAANKTVRCDRWVYNKTYYQSSRAIEWNFVCGRLWMGAVAQSIFMLGVLTGSLVLGNLADKYGRKPILCSSAVLQLVIGVAVAFTRQYPTFLVLRYLLGIFGAAGSYITGFVLTMELVGPSKRTICGMTFQIGFAAGIMLVAGWAALIKDRLILQVVYGLHAVVLLPHLWIMDESPRWLLVEGRVSESLAIVRKALKVNKIPISLDRATCTLNKHKLSTISQAAERTHAGALDLFRTPHLRNVTLNVSFCFFANSLAYYGLSLNTGELGGNPYINLFLTGVVELPSYVVTVCLMDRIGRRPLIAFDMIMGAAACITASFLPAGSASCVATVMVGKCMLSGSFAILFNYAAELFPTVVRNSGMGIGAMCARTSGAMTPLISLLNSLDPRLPANIFAGVTLVSGLLTLLLPETLDRPMPQTLQDGEEFGKGDTCCRSCCGKR